MRELDRQTNWSKKLHQDRFKFVEKYKEILEEYLRRTANDKNSFNSAWIYDIESGATLSVESDHLIINLVESARLFVGS